MSQPDRYHRQQILPQIGPAAQQKLAAARVLLVGCGALGCVIADQLARGGIGNLRIADRDLVERTNLQRQMLFDEADAHAQTPKAVAAAVRLRAINSAVTIEPVVVDVDAGNVERLLDFSGAAPNVILDGTDNIETRYLLNDVAVKHQCPWVYAACVGVEARVMAIHPGQTACLRCLFPAPPDAGELPTCDTAGVLAAAAAVAGSLAVVEALRLLIGAPPSARLVSANVWEARYSSIDISERDPACPACAGRRFDYLDQLAPAAATSLCGRDAVQIKPAARAIDLADAARRLALAGTVERTPYLVRCRLSDAPLTLTAFPDGRLLVSGTRDLARARALYARYFGS